MKVIYMTDEQHAALVTAIRMGCMQNRVSQLVAHMLQHRGERPADGYEQDIFTLEGAVAAIDRPVDTSFHEADNRRQRELVSAIYNKVRAFRDEPVPEGKQPMSSLQLIRLIEVACLHGKMPDDDVVSA